MKKIIYMLICLNTIIGCQLDPTTVTAVPNYNPNLNRSDQVFDAYIERTEVILNGSVGNVIIRFFAPEEEVDLKDTISGICIHRDNVILIKKSLWYKSIEERKRGLIIHEIGHCVFHKKHSEDNVNSDCNDTIMHPRTECSFTAYVNLTYEQIKTELRGK